MEHEKKRLAESIESFGERGLDVSMKESTDALSAYDNHPADLANTTFEREKDFGLREDQMTTMDMVEKALRRLDEGSYGRCQRCGRPISAARLDAVPWTAYCVRCEAALEEEEARDWRRPAEEDVRPAFSSFNDRDPRDSVGFDGEDSWQAVARFGTSNTPADTPPAVGYGETYIDADEDNGVAERMDAIPDSTFDPGQVGEEGTLEYRDGWIVNDGETREERVPNTGSEMSFDAGDGHGPTGKGPASRSARGRRRRSPERKNRPES